MVFLAVQDRWQQSVMINDDCEMLLTDQDLDWCGTSKKPWRSYKAHHKSQARPRWSLGPSSAVLPMVPALHPPCPARGGHLRLLIRGAGSATHGELWDGHAEWS